tara:strand:+ start:14972 stop:15802 length:831 start_codon:yes stop_codon:yes gene_type:complete
MKKNIIKSSKIWLDFFRQKIRNKRYYFKNEYSKKVFDHLNENGYAKINIFDIEKDIGSDELINFFNLIEKNFKVFENSFENETDIVNKNSRKADYQIRAAGTDIFKNIEKDFYKIREIGIFKEILEYYFDDNLINFQNDFWITFRNKEFNGRQASQRWHSDPEFHRVIKIFFYFNDVNDENGPTEYIPKTFLSGKKNSLLLRLYNFPHISSYYPEWFVNLIYGKKNRFKALAKRGDIYIFNTTGLHRGGYVKNGKRKLGIFSFTNNNSPYLKETYI